VKDAIDGALELAVVPSFTRIGHDARRRLYDWRPIEDYDLSGRRVAITGANSGLGLAAARDLAGAGAEVIILGRSADKLRDARQEIDDAVGSSGSVSTVVVDLSDLDQVREAAAEIAAATDRLDALVHNAGALSAEREENAAGIEMTVASQVVGPFALTAHLLDVLRAAEPGRVITMSSGGMYAAPLTVDGLQMSADHYGGSEQYARAKRAQVTLNEMWAERVDAGEIVFHALHPGWSDTPGVQRSLPTFARVVGPLLRDPEQGADTMEWLVAADEPLASTGAFWHDRRKRSIHRLARTRRSDTAERRQRLWDWCVSASGVDPDLADR
jgi:dehydrogenase/reductase SDR family protein 12